ncbi:MAG TPA: TetR/AcrR family transcriptional regulator [Caulobacteraceae bacterium]
MPQLPEGRDAQLAAEPRPKPRVIKPPAVRRAELIDCAQALFLAKGYERTTINDVIVATGLSKGAFYHHFRAKEDLLEAIAERFARQALTQALDVQNDPSLSALDRLNRLLAMSRDWKAENIGPLRAMFTVLLRPENATLYHRIVEAVFRGMAPTVAAIIANGEREGVFSTPDAMLAAEALLWLGEGRRVFIVEAMARADSGDIEGATQLIMRRIRAEEAMIDRVLGLPAGAIDFAGSEAFIRTLVKAWVAP